MRALPILLALTGAAAAPPASEFDTSKSEMRPPIEAFAADRGNLMRTYNDALPSRQSRLQQFYREWQERLPRFDFDSMSQDGKVDYVLFRNLLSHEVRKLELDARLDADTAPYVPFAPAILRLEEERRKFQPVQSQEAAAALSSLPKRIEDARRTIEAKLRADTTPEEKRNRKIAANRTLLKLNALRNTLRAWFSFYDGYDPVFTWWNAEAYRTADQAIQSYITWLREKVLGLSPQAAAEAAPAPSTGRGRTFGTGPRVPSGARAGSTDDIVGSPIGREGLLNELAYEMIPYTPEELIALAEKELAWCETEMKRAANEMGFGDDWKAALEKVKTMHVDPGKQPQMIRDLALEAEKFMDDHDLITIPPLARETWRMEMMSPELQLVNPFFTGGEVISVSFPTSSMTFEQKMMSMRGNNIPMSRATVFHELIPGHHLQGYMAARYRPYRAVVGGTPFITEGWSLYWELLLWDMKFHKTPADRVGALFWHMHRCARIIFSLSFHLGTMSPEECVNLLVNRVGHERENAAGEVRRSFAGNYSPLYQAAYLLGGMQLYALHKELVDSGKMTNRQFHDAVLKENRIPVEMIRASLTGQRLTRDYTANWRFR